MSRLIRRYYRFYGRVQGVGFRYQMRRHAAELGLTGRVKNLYDGSVEAEVQGTADALLKLLALLDRDPFIRLERVDGRDLPLNSEERGFIAE